MFSGIIDAVKNRDIPTLARLEQECFAFPWSRASLRSIVNVPRIVFVAAREAAGEKPVGYAAMETVLDEGYVYNVAVTAAARRQGVGRALMEYLIAEGRRRELSFISLEVRVSNAPAIALYERLGFVRAGLRQHYYKKPAEDALIMTLFLKRPDSGETSRELSEQSPPPEAVDRQG